MKYLIVVISSLLVIDVAFSLDFPQGSYADGRIQFVEYNPDDVVQVNASVAIGSQIVFSENEEILDIASGFSQGWEFANRGSILFLKVKSVKTNAGTAMPNPQDWNTNLLVTTDKRLYAFDINVVDKKIRAHGDTVSYRVKFKYSKDDMIARNNKLQAERAQKQKEWAAKETDKRLKNNRYSALNWDYTMQVGNNSRNIAPFMAYDDGRFTYLKFSVANEFPVAFLVDGKEESIINSHVESDVLVLHRVAKEFVLRSGDKVVGIYNERFGSQRLNESSNGTNVPGVKRVIKPSL